MRWRRSCQLRDRQNPTLCVPGRRAAGSPRRQRLQLAQQLHTPCSASMGGKTQAGRRDSETEFGNPIADDGAELAVGNSDSDDVETGEHAEVFEAEGEGNAEQDEAEWGELSLKGITYGDVDNFILNWCRNACASKWMDSCILTCILLNTGLLAAAAPANTYSEETLQIFVIIDMVLTVRPQNLWHAGPVVNAWCAADNFYS